MELDYGGSIRLLVIIVSVIVIIVIITTSSARHRRHHHHHHHHHHHQVGPVHSGSVTSHPNLSIYRHCVDFRAPNKKESFLSNHFLSSGTINRKQKIFQKIRSQAGLLCIIIGWYCRILLNDLLD